MNKKLIANELLKIAKELVDDKSLRISEERNSNTIQRLRVALMRFKKELLGMLKTLEAIDKYDLDEKFKKIKGIVFHNLEELKDIDKDIEKKFWNLYESNKSVDTFYMELYHMRHSLLDYIDKMYDAIK